MEQQQSTTVATQEINDVEDIDDIIEFMDSI